MVAHRAFGKCQLGEFISSSPQCVEQRIQRSGRMQSAAEGIGNAWKPQQRLLQRVGSGALLCTRTTSAPSPNLAKEGPLHLNHRSRRCDSRLGGQLGVH